MLSIRLYVCPYLYVSLSCQSIHPADYFVMITKYQWASILWFFCLSVGILSQFNFLCKFILTYTYVYTNIHINNLTHTYACTHAQNYTYTHKHTDIDTHKNSIFDPVRLRGQKHISGGLINSANEPISHHFIWVELWV